MRHFSIVMSDSDIEDFEEGRAKERMSKSAYIRYLIAEHEHAVPATYKYKEIISLLASIDNAVHEIVVNEKFEPIDRMELYEKFEKLRLEIMKIIR